MDTVWRQNSEAVDSQLDHMERALDETYKLRDMHKGIKVLARYCSTLSMTLHVFMRDAEPCTSEHGLLFLRCYLHFFCCCRR